MRKSANRNPFKGGAASIGQGSRVSHGNSSSAKQQGVRGEVIDLISDDEAPAPKVIPKPLTGKTGLVAKPAAVTISTVVKGEVKAANSSTAAKEVIVIDDDETDDESFFDVRTVKATPTQDTKKEQKVDVAPSLSSMKVEAVSIPIGPRVSIISSLLKVEGTSMPSGPDSRVSSSEANRKQPPAVGTTAGPGEAPAVGTTAGPGEAPKAAADTALTLAPPKAAVSKPAKRSTDASKIKSKGGKTGTKKQDKDPNAPKKPQTAYFLFLGERRADYKKENPEKSFGELTKGMSEEWKVLSVADKKKYEDKAVAEKAIYIKTMERYVPPETVAGPAVSSSSSAKSVAPPLPVEKMVASSSSDAKKTPEGGAGAGSSTATIHRKRSNQEAFGKGTQGEAEPSAKKSKGSCAESSVAWTCSACTYRNEVKQDKCEMCDVGAVEWVCSICTYHNQDDRNQCVMCNSDRVGVGGAVLNSGELTTEATHSGEREAASETLGNHQTEGSFRSFPPGLKLAQRSTVTTLEGGQMDPVDGSLAPSTALLPKQYLTRILRMVQEKGTRVLVLPSDESPLPRMDCSSNTERAKPRNGDESNERDETKDMADPERELHYRTIMDKSRRWNAGVAVSLTDLEPFVSCLSLAKGCSADKVVVSPEDKLDDEISSEDKCDILYGQMLSFVSRALSTVSEGNESTYDRIREVLITGWRSMGLQPSVSVVAVSLLRLLVEKRQWPLLNSREVIAEGFAMATRVLQRFNAVTIASYDANLHGELTLALDVLALSSQSPFYEAGLMEAVRQQLRSMVEERRFDTLSFLLFYAASQGHAALKDSLAMCIMDKLVDCDLSDVHLLNSLRLSNLLSYTSDAAVPDSIRAVMVGMILENESFCMIENIYRRSRLV